MTARIEKTVFISYRRTNFYTALAVYQDLTQHGYDVFFDFQSIDSGDFEKIITENIKSKAHFLIILSPSALERCNEPGDWLRHEIEIAMDEKRNIVPLMMEGFDFGSSSVKQALSGKLAALNRYNSLRLVADYFFEAMEKLRRRFLNIALEDISLFPVSAETKELNDTRKVSVNEESIVETNELTAEEWFERGYVFATETKNFDEAIRCFTEAIHHKPDFAEAYANRATAFRDKHRIALLPKKGDLLNATKDYTKAIRLRPNYALCYGSRGGVYADQGNPEKAIKDCTHAIQLDPTLSLAYNNRGGAYYILGDWKKAIEDYSEAIQIDPKFADAYRNRGIVRDEHGDKKGAIQDFTKAIRIKPSYAAAYIDRGVTRQRKGSFESAIKDYNKALRLDPNDATAYYNRAYTRYARYDLKGAIADFQKYLDLWGGIRSGDQKEVEKMIRKLKQKNK